MNQYFSEALRRLRTEKGISQLQLAERMSVNQSTVARWENGSRLPDAMMIFRLSEVFGVDINTLLSTAARSEEHPNVIMVDDRRIILNGGIPILEAVLPQARVTGFTRSLEAIEFAKTNRISLAFLDIELGSTSGLELCRILREIHPGTNVVFLTAYAEYSLDAWSTGACGFLIKPITAEAVREQLKRLRYPLFSGGAGG